MAFYQDWTFWSFVCAAIAIALSQMPPLWMWIIRRALYVDVYTHIMVAHNIGYPVIQLHLSLSNQGTRDARVHRIRLKCKRQGSADIELNATGYYEKHNDPSSVLLAPFTLAPRQEWSHILVFSKLLDRQAEKSLREATSNTQETIESQQHEYQAQGGTIGARYFKASPKDLDKLEQIFDRAFCWHEANYGLEVEVVDPKGHVLSSKKYRFTLFEADERLLRSFKDDYVYGAGVYFPSTKRQLFVSVEGADQ